jgi:hypothetical protein
VPNQLPSDWATLNVARDLGIRGSYPQDLRIKRQVKSKNLYAQWLPSPDDDARPNQGRGSGGKRLTLSQSMGTDDPYEAGKRAIAWVQRKQRELREQKDEVNAQREYALSRYWEKWFARECSSRGNQRNFTRWKRDTRLKWDGQGYGICHQPWAQKSVEQITFLDFSDYWAVLESRRTPGTDMSGIKAQQKTLIRKLMKEARTDFPKLAIPEFPVISKQVKQVAHLTNTQWERLVAKIVDLSGGTARQKLTNGQYASLQWSSRNRLSIRNWVDLYDALHLQWFFYLRAEDMPRLRSEWFRDQGDGTVLCFLEETKGNRLLHQTFHYRPDAYSFWERMVLRRPAGYLILPHLFRPRGNESDSHCLETLNFLLKNAMTMCDPPIHAADVTWTTIRHTAFRLTLEEFPELGVPPRIDAFAFNGHTSAKMLQERYLKYIDAEKTAKEARERIKPGQWSMVKRVEL